MGLLLVFLVSLVVGQSLSIGIGLLVERLTTPYTGLMAFIACYFTMFWLAWRFAVRVTKPRERLAGSEADESGHLHAGRKSNAVLLGAYAATEDLWTQSDVAAQRRLTARKACKKPRVIVIDQRARRRSTLPSVAPARWPDAFDKMDRGVRKILGEHAVPAISGQAISDCEACALTLWRRENDLIPIPPLTVHSITADYKLRPRLRQKIFLRGHADVPLLARPLCTRPITA